MSTTATRRDGALTTISIVVWVFMLGAAALSFMHLVQTGYKLGLGWEAWTLFIFVDGLAIVGKVSMLPRFSPAFRKSGFRLLMLGGLLSLGANVFAGENIGQRVFGVLVVAGFMALEHHAAKATRTAALPAPAPTGRKLDPTVAAQRAAKARATRERNQLAKLTPAQKAAETRRRNATMPVSPAPATGPVRDLTEAEDLALASV